jgi:serine/threonine protein kinase
MSKLLSQGGYGCIYYPGIKCDGKPQNNKKVVSKLQIKNDVSENEIKIGKLIMTIPNYILFFYPVISNCPVNIRSIDSKVLLECNSLYSQDNNNNKDKYVLMEIPYAQNKTFYDILIGMFKSKKRIFVGLIETYTYLLDSIIILLNKNIVHFDIKNANILYNQYTSLPVIIDFGISINLTDVMNNGKLSFDIIKKIFYVYSPDYYVWCLEIHVINLLINRETQTLTLTDIKEISSEYVRNNKALDIFSDEFRGNYLLACETYLTRYVGMDKQKTIELLFSFNNTWDNYSLSILYLKTFSLMFPRGFHKNTLILYFSQILLYNIHPDPSKRYSLEKTKHLFNDVFYMEGEIDDYIHLLSEFDYDINYTTKAIQADINNLNKTKAVVMFNKR